MGITRFKDQFDGDTLGDGWNVTIDYSIWHVYKWWQTIPPGALTHGSYVRDFHGTSTDDADIRVEDHAAVARSYHAGTEYDDDTFVVYRAAILCERNDFELAAGQYTIGVTALPWMFPTSRQLTNNISPSPFVLQQTWVGVYLSPDTPTIAPLPDYNGPPYWSQDNTWGRGIASTAPSYRYNALPFRDGVTNSCPVVLSGTADRDTPNRKVGFYFDWTGFFKWNTSFPWDYPPSEILTGIIGRVTDFDVFNVPFGSKRGARPVHRVAQDTGAVFAATTHEPASSATEIAENDYGALLVPVGETVTRLDSKTLYIGQIPQPGDWGTFNWNDQSIDWSE